MNTRFTRNLVFVGVLHVVAVLVLFLLTSSRAEKREPEPVRFIPVELVADIPPVALPGPKEAPPEEPEPPEPEIPTPPKPKPKPKPKPAPKPRPKKRLVRRRVAPTPQLSQEDIEKLLGPAVKTAPSPASPSDATYRAIIHQTFHDAWNQPGYADVGDAVAFVTVSLRSDGSVAGCKLSRSSGNSLLDSTVMSAANSIRRIPGLSTDFIARNRTLTVSFRVEES